MNHNTLSTPDNTSHDEVTLSQTEQDVFAGIEQSFNNESVTEVEYPGQTVATEANRIITLDIIPQPETNSDIVEQNDETLEKYNKSTSKAVDWMAEKTDKSAGNLYDLAYRIDQEGMKEFATSVLRSIGRAALEEVKKEVGTDIAQISWVADKVKGAAIKANQHRKTRREAKRKENVRKEMAARQAKVYQEEIASVYDEAHQMNKRYDEEADAQKMDALYSTEVEAYKINDEYDAHAENDIYNAHVEATQMNEVYDAHTEALKIDDNLETQKKIEAARREAAIHARAARVRTLRRRQARREFGQRNLNRLRVGGKRLRSAGRTIARFTRNTKNYVSGIHQAGLENVRATNAPKAEAPLVESPRDNESQRDYDLAA